MLVSMLTRGTSGMEIDVPRERRNLGGNHRRHVGGTRRTCRVSLGDVSYEVKAEESLKSHLTRRMVTSSLKSSPQKSAVLSTMGPRRTLKKRGARSRKAAPCQVLRQAGSRLSDAGTIPTLQPRS
jgi:hypothetical protein